MIHTYHLDRLDRLARIVALRQQLTDAQRAIALTDDPVEAEQIYLDAIAATRRLLELEKDAA